MKKLSDGKEEEEEEDSIVKMLDIENEADVICNKKDIEVSNNLGMAFDPIITLHA